LGVKNLGIAFLALSFLAICMGNSFAQAPLIGVTPFNYPQSTLSTDTSVSADVIGSYFQVDPALHSPRLFAAWSPNASSIKLAATASDYLGAFDNVYGEGTLEWSTNGLWLGLSLPMQVNERLSVDLQGWYFFPGNEHIEVSGRASGLYHNNPQSIDVGGNLDIKTTWFAIDLEGCCRASAQFAVLAGVRYDYLQGTITGVGPIETLALNQLPGLRPQLDVNLNSIFPYLGFRSSLPIFLGSLTLSIKGFPRAISVGDVHPKSGYFAEAFFSYDLLPSRDLSLSFIAKADAAHASFDDSSQAASIFNQGPYAPQNRILEQSLSVTWQQYYIGGVATLNFAFPLL
jgi:hypothetical protein